MLKCASSIQHNSDWKFGPYSKENSVAFRANQVWLCSVEGIFIRDEQCASYGVVPFNLWLDCVIPCHFCASGSAKCSNFGKKKMVIMVIMVRQYLQKTELFSYENNFIHTGCLKTFFLMSTFTTTACYLSSRVFWKFRLYTGNRNSPFPNMMKFECVMWTNHYLASLPQTMF